MNNEIQNKDKGNKIASLVLDKYNSFPSKGKCQEHEWTCLAGIVMEKWNNMSCIAIGTGTKCLSEDKLNDNGSLVDDCHAEVIARRSFLLFLLDQILLWHKNVDESIFQMNNESSLLEIKEGIQFHFYISQSPCGEACNFEMNNAKRVAEEIYDSKQRNSKRRKVEESTSNILQLNNQDNENEMNQHKTGAKAILSSTSSVYSHSSLYTHIPLRIKPGRGISTLSNCCSDKLALWATVGIQGKLLSCIMNPIYLSSITITDLYNEDALRRTFDQRLSSITHSIHNYIPHPPLLYNTTNITIPFSEIQVLQRLKGMKKMSACGSTLSWCKDRSVEVIAGITGLKLGASTKMMQLPPEKVQSNLSRKMIFHYYRQILKELSLFQNIYDICTTYKSIKEYKNEYKEYKMYVINEYTDSAFYGWKQKDIDKYYNFS
ncbi:hypothetical protein WA158_007406 [Blastocystis sp. Blastoise]